MLCHSRPLPGAGTARSSLVQQKGKFKTPGRTSATERATAALNKRQLPRVVGSLDELALEGPPFEGDLSWSPDAAPLRAFVLSDEAENKPAWDRRSIMAYFTTISLVDAGLTGNSLDGFQGKDLPKTLQVGRW